MSNFTSFPFVESLATSISPPSLPYLATLFVINLPLLAIAINVLRQLLIPRNPNEPPVVFHWLPILGSAVQYGTDPVGFFLRCREKYGDIFTFILLGRRMTVALGPKGSNFILGGKLAEVSAEEAYTPLTTPVFGQGVVYDCPNHMLMEQKKFVKVGLSLDNFRAYVPMIVKEVEDFFKEDPAFSVYNKGNTKEWGTFLGYQKMAEITILTASRTLQGREVRDSLDKGFAQRYHDLDGGFTSLNFLFPSLPLPSYRKRDIAQKAMSDFYVDIIKKRREEGRLEDGGDMIAALSAQSYKDGRAVTDREVAHMMIALLMAGQHTSSTTGAWALMNVAANPKVCEALYAEQVEYFSNPDGTLRPLTYEELKKLPLLDAVIKETLRRHAPIHSIIRKVVQDMQVPPTLGAPKDERRTYVVPKGNFVLASPSASQMDNKVWKDPSTWDPYRWLDESGFAANALATYDGQASEKIDYGYGAVSKGTESVYQPFGAGRHRCIGEQFAHLQIGTILSTFVRNLEMSMDQVPPANYQTLIAQPLGPCEIRYRRRPVHGETA